MTKHILQDYGFYLDHINAHLSHLDFSKEDLEKIHSWVKTPKGFLVLLGNAGIGKTYVAAALANEFINTQIEFRYFKENTFLSKLRGFIERNQGYEGEITRICDTNVIFFDELGVSQLTDWQQEVIFSFVDQRHGNCQPTIILSNLTPREIREKFHQRFYSRLFDKRNTVVDLFGYEDRREENQNEHA